MLSGEPPGLIEKGTQIRRPPKYFTDYDCSHIKDSGPNPWRVALQITKENRLDDKDWPLIQNKEAANAPLARGNGPIRHVGLPYFAHGKQRAVFMT